MRADQSASGEKPNVSTRHASPAVTRRVRPAVVPGQEKTTRGHQRCEPPKNPFELLERVVAIEVVEFDAENGGLLWPQVQKVRPILAGLDQHQRPFQRDFVRCGAAVPAAQCVYCGAAVSAALCRRDACTTNCLSGTSAGGRSQWRGAADDRRVPSGGHQQMGGHCRDGRFSVRAGHSHRAAADAQPTEHLKVTRRPNVALGGPPPLRVLHGHGVAIDDFVGLVRQISGVMALEQPHARGGQRLHARHIQVRAAELPPPAQQHVGQCPHPVAGDPHQMHPPRPRIASL